MARAGEEEHGSNSALSTNFPSLAEPHKHPITKEKMVALVVLFPSVEKGAKINVPTGDSSDGVLTMQCALPTALVDPTKFIHHAFSDAPLMRLVV